MDWPPRPADFLGSAIFPTATPDRSQIEADLARAGVSVRALPAEGPAASWCLELTHPAWGEAQLDSRPDMGAPSEQILALTPGLTPGEREVAQRGRSGVALTMACPGEDPLRERKAALRFLHAVMGDAGLYAMDALSMLIWSHASLEYELGHDAALSVDGVHCFHVLSDGEGTRPTWLHSHGLAAMGAMDFDVLQPADWVLQGQNGALSAIALAILEGALTEDEESFALAQPGGEVRLVPVAQFTAEADPRYGRELRDPEDPDHNTDRGVLCDPATTGFFSRFAWAARPASFLMAEVPEGTILNLSTASTQLRAQRARETYPAIATMIAALAPLPYQAVVKLGYETDSGQPHGHEHMWFEVSEFHPDSVEAELLNQPFDIASMNQGDRGRHSVERLTDWSIMTPLGNLSPSSTHVLRSFEERRQDILEALAQAED